MKVSDVSEHDGVMFASAMQIMAIADKLFDALKLAGMPIQGPGMSKRADVAIWLREHSLQLAKAIEASRAAGDQSMKIKNMGPLPAPAKAARKKKDK